MIRKMMVLMAALFLLSSSTAWALECAADNNCDGKVNLTDLVKMKQEYLRNDCDPVCLAGVPGGVPKTGQTLCYNTSGALRDCTGTGEDGEYRKGVAWPNPRFVDNGNGTVTDNLTGLIWLKNANCFGVKIWNQALSDCSGLTSGSCGLTDGSNAGDWRLPNRKELESLLDLGQLNPSLPSGHPFINVPSDFSDYYWSSTTNNNDTASAWTIHIGRGHVGYGYKNNYSYYVWPVRGGSGLFASCMEECESELELCLMGCEGWPPESQYICNDNCVFDYSSNCVPACP